MHAEKKRIKSRVFPRNSSMNSRKTQNCEQKKTQAKTTGKEKYHAFTRVCRKFEDEREARGRK